jgi:hypothetical protein
MLSLFNNSFVKCLFFLSLHQALKACGTICTRSEDDVGLGGYRGVRVSTFESRDRWGRIALSIDRMYLISQKYIILHIKWNIFDYDYSIFDKGSVSFLGKGHVN